MAGKKTSNLDAGVPPYDGASLVALSVPDPIVGGYKSRKALLSDVAPAATAGASARFLNLAGSDFAGELDASGDTVLRFADITDTQVTTATFAGDTSLTDLGVLGCSNLSALDVTDCSSLATLDVSTDATLTSLIVSGCNALTSINAQGTGISALDVSALQGLAALSLNGLSLLESLDASNCPLLGGVDVGDCSSLTSIDASGCALPSAVVDAILAQLDANGESGGTVDLSGGTNEAPSAAGLAAKATLEGRGWTVTVTA